MFKEKQDKITFQTALFDPSGVFSHPEDVLDQKDFTKDQKVQILEQWLRDEREMDVAAEENMQGPHDSGNVIDAIHKALLQLGVDSESHLGPPTKHGF